MNRANHIRGRENITLQGVLKDLYFTNILIMILGLIVFVFNFRLPYAGFLLPDYLVFMIIYIVLLGIFILLDYLNLLEGHEFIREIFAGTGLSFFDLFLSLSALGWLIYAITTSTAQVITYMIGILIPINSVLSVFRLRTHYRHIDQQAAIDSLGSSRDGGGLNETDINGVPNNNVPGAEQRPIDSSQETGTPVDAEPSDNAESSETSPGQAANDR